MNDEINTLSTFQWWNKRRLHYNVSLICAGILAFICYVMVIYTSGDVIPDAEITIFTTLFQGIGYLILIGLANIFFFAGPIFEKLIKPKNVIRYRTIAYKMGYWFSVLLPFSIPAILIYLVLFFPEYWTK